MTDVELLELHCNTWNHLTVQIKLVLDSNNWSHLSIWEQMINIK